TDNGSATFSVTLGTAGLQTVTATDVNNGADTGTSGSIMVAAGAPAASASTITGTSPVVADGVASSVVTITLADTFSNPIAGTTPTFSATGTSNILGACSIGDASGASTCALKSTTAETKALAIAAPVALTGGTVTFTPGGAVAGRSTISGTSPVTANGIATSTVTITLR